MRGKLSVFILLTCFFMAMNIILNYNVKGRIFAESIFENEIESESCILLNSDTNTVIFSKNERERLPIASMCKIMTLLMCFEEIDKSNLSFDEKIIVSENASGMGGSQVFLETNGEYSVYDLLKSITVASANDACVAMAERISGSEALFVKAMNEKAKLLNMDNTVFVNCTGLPKSGQYSCAYDVSLMFSELLKHKDYFTFSNIWMDEISHPEGRKTQISNTNKLIRYYDGCDSGKTGYTSEAGHCLVASAFKNDFRLICVVIKSPNSKRRFKEVSDMFNFGFANYNCKTVIDDINPLDISVDVVNGKNRSISVKADKSIKVFSQKDVKHSYEISFAPNKEVKAPLYVGDVVGKLTVFENGIEIATVNVVANEQIDERSYFDCIKDIIYKWSIVS